mgnify:CR=1 FL=1|jgi:hypothetical protein
MTTFTVKAGKTNLIKLVYKDAAGNIIDLTGASARLVARQDYYKDPVLTKAAVITGATGEILFKLDPVDTATILTDKTEDDFVVDVELTVVGGDVFDLFTDARMVIKQSAAR